MSKNFTSSIKVDSSNSAYYLQFFIKKYKNKKQKVNPTRIGQVRAELFPIQVQKMRFKSNFFSLGQVNRFNSGQFCQFHFLHLFDERTGQIEILLYLNKKKKNLCSLTKYYITKWNWYMFGVPEIINRGPRCVQFNCWYIVYDFSFYQLRILTYTKG